MPSDITIRQAVLDDSPAIFEAHQDSVLRLCAGSYTTDQLQTWFEGRTHEIHHPAIKAGQIFIAERRGRVLGFFGSVPGEITLLFVRPEAAGSGLGSRLLTLAVGCAEVGHEGPLAVVATRNSQRFYEKHGFTAVEASFFVRGACEMHFEVVNMRRGDMASPSGGLAEPVAAMQVRLAIVADVSRICALIRSLSDPFFLLPGGEDAELFLQSVGESAIQGYVAAVNFRYQVAEVRGQLVGIVALRDNSHLFHLFVASAFQGRGIARELWQLAREHAMGNGNPGRFTVNSSLDAVPVYERFGFVASGPVVAKHGISFRPMLLIENGG